MVSINKPNFFIVGAAKSATTSIFHYLNHHPDIFFPNIKEPKYFSSKYINFPQNGPGDSEYTDKITIKELDSYLELYKKASDYKILGDASVDSLYYYETAEDIKKFSPNAKILIILRNPVERAFSHYSHLVRDGRESKTFERALELEDDRIKSGYEFSWFYRKAGLYFEQVKRFIDIFGNNTKVILFEDIKKDPKKTIEEICFFLDVNFNSISNISMPKHNSSGLSKSIFVTNLINKPHFFKEYLKKLIPFHKRSRLKAYINSINTTELHLEFKIKEELQLYFAEDINKLEKLLNFNLSNWK